MINISEMIEKCHNASVQGGWYTNLETGEPLDRNIGEMMVLIHSEISESFDAFSKDTMNLTMDDKLTHRLGIEVELADTAIRIFDLAGYKQLNLCSPSVESDQHFDPYFEYLVLHSFISSAYEGYRKSNRQKFEQGLTNAIYQIIYISNNLKLDLESAILEKLEFNSKREDHKLENRKKPGGKRT